MSRSQQDRHREIDEYVSTLHDVGAVFRTFVRTKKVDYWATSSLRESSTWTSPALDALTLFRRAAVGANTRPTTTSRTGFVASVARCKAMGYWLLNLAQSSLRQSPRMSGAIILVVYMTAGHSLSDARKLATRYYGSLPDVLERNGISFSVLLLASESRPAVRVSRKGNRPARRRSPEAVEVADFATPRVLLSALRDWFTLQAKLPRLRRMLSLIVTTRARDLVTVMAPTLVESFFGTVSMRSALYVELFDKALQQAEAPRVVLYPFEGQGWESSLEQACMRRGVRTLPYLHTMMKPWDLRAHTALRECPPREILVHGRHDIEELTRHSVLLTPVEALRYEYLNSVSPKSLGVPDSGRILVILGADCERSHSQMTSFCAAVQHRYSTWQLRVRQHPQCDGTKVTEISEIAWSSGSLHDDLAWCTGAFLCGTAAPLDSYLFGVPTVVLADPRGFDVSPLENDDSFYLAPTVEDAMHWLDNAQRLPLRQPEVGRFFNLTPDLPKWKGVLERVLTFAA